MFILDGLAVGNAAWRKNSTVRLLVRGRSTCYEKLPHRCTVQLYLGRVTRAAGGLRFDVVKARVAVSSATIVSAAEDVVELPTVIESLHYEERRLDEGQNILRKNTLLGGTQRGVVRDAVLRGAK
jgi:hypothetical protein